VWPVDRRTHSKGFHCERNESPTGANRNEGMSEDQRRQIEKAKKMSRKSVPKPVPEAKASKPTKGQESPETKVSHPMVTRGKEVSRAGGLRPGSGSGQTDTRATKGRPSKT
jgi:hypothetical protein